MGLRNLLGGRKKGDSDGTASERDVKSQPRSGKGRACMYGHPVPRGKKMCEHRHWVG